MNLPQFLIQEGNASSSESGVACLSPTALYVPLQTVVKLLQLQLDSNSFSHVFFQFNIYLLELQECNVEMTLAFFN